MLQKYKFFVGTLPFLTIVKWVAMETVQLHKTKMDLFLRTIILHLSGPIKQTYMHKNMSVVVITPWDPRLSNDFFPDVLSFH